MQWIRSKELSPRFMPQASATSPADPMSVKASSCLCGTNGKWEWWGRYIFHRDTRLPLVQQNRIFAAADAHWTLLA